MSKKTSKTLIGIFVVGSMVLLMGAIVVFGSGELFKRSNKFVLYFDGTVQGLSIGAPVMFRGVNIGKVKDISLIYDAKAGTITLPVIVELDQDRVQGSISFNDLDADKKMIALGLRGKLQMQSFLTGQLIIAFDFYPKKPARLLGIANKYPELPTLPNTPDIFEVINEMPIKQISKDLELTAQSISKLVNSNEIHQSVYELHGTLQETKEAMHSFALLTEYLEQHPESLLKGKVGP